MVFLVVVIAFLSFHGYQNGMHYSQVPVCLNRKFVNNQNARSFKDIFKQRIFKTKVKHEESTSFFHELVSGLRLSDGLHKVLKTLLENLLMNSKDDFKKFFSDIKMGESLEPVNKADILKSCMIALRVIIPKGFFGGPSNERLFEKVVRTVIYSMKSQHIVFGQMITEWDFSSQLWQSMETGTANKALYDILLWITKDILAAIISLNFYVTTCKLDADDNKLYFFWKSHWQSFYDTKIRKMVFARVLTRYEPYCLGKKCKKNYNLGERLQLKTIKNSIPKLCLVLKKNNDCRPIVRYKSVQQPTEKYKMKEKFNFFKMLTERPQMKIETQFSFIHQEWLKLGKPKLYFIKTDLINAFGSVNRENLLKMFSERHAAFQETEQSSYLKKITAQQYREMVTELRKPLLVRTGSTVYVWTQGLVQGYKYSPALSELYYTCLDEAYLSEHIKKPESGIRFFTRVVDDYLYITDSFSDAQSFLQALSKHRNVNYKKTVVNFEHEGIKSSNEITFLGNTYDTTTLQVSRANTAYIGEMCYKIAFSYALNNKSKFLENRISQSGIQITGHIFNLYYNSEELIWKHIFTTFCLSANKFCTILAVLCVRDEMEQFLPLYKKRVAVKLSQAMIEMLMRYKPKDYMFVYCINHFRHLAFKALYLCAKHTSKCNSLINSIKDEMAKTNCLFGPWREHLARIDPTGEIRKPAVKQVCRRLDLRVIVKNFDKLPSGFQCYNHKKLS